MGREGLRRGLRASSLGSLGGSVLEGLAGVGVPGLGFQVSQGAG